MKPLKFVLIISEVIFYVTAITHWIATDDGKIQSNLNSIFTLKQPYDLLTFLEQEKRESEADKLFEKIVAKKASIDVRWAQIDLLANVENMFYTTDLNCQKIERDKTNINLFASIATDGSFRQGITSKDFLLNDNIDETENLVPDCMATFPLDFSMYTFEHLQAMRNRQNLSQPQEKELIQYLSPGMGIDIFGSHIAYGLLKNQTSWVHFNLGAIYWRYKGDSYKAMECARRAIVTAPRQYRDIPLLTTGGILHAARQSAEAAVVLHTAINYAPDQSRQHLALGNIYATLGDYKRAITCYDNCLKLSPNMQQAHTAKHAILCHQKIEETLTTLHNQLQEILDDLQSYDREQKEWLQLTENIIQDKETKRQYLGLPEDWDLLFDGPTQTCTQIDENSPILSCEVSRRSHMLPANLQIDVNVNPQMLKNIEKHAKKINKQIIKSKLLYGLSDESQMKVQKRKETKPFELFVESDIKFDDNKNNNFDLEEWTTFNNCHNYELPFKIVKRDYIPIFPKTDYRFYVFSDSWNLEHENEFVSSHLPGCKTKDNSHNYFTAKLLKLLELSEQSSTTYKPETELKSDLTDLMNNKNLHEISKRISLAMKTETKELWIVYAISSLYWRVKGKFHEALSCAQSALDSAPSDLKNIPLINIASILQRFGRTDEALAVIKQALNINPEEPTANFLYGLFLHTINSNTDAMDYLKRAIRYKLHSVDDRALSLLKLIACRIKFD